MNFDDMVGKEFDFYGVDNNAFKLDDTVFEAIENPDDGYRSMLDSVEVKDPTGLIFFSVPVARVKVEKVEDSRMFTSYVLRGLDGHAWLDIGTSDVDDYYPCFVFSYSPRSPE